jgi:hypothetical protein
MRMSSVFLNGVAAVMLVGGVWSAGAQGVGAQASSGVPRLERRGTAVRLVVDGTPFVAMSGELTGDAATSEENMEPVWPKLVAANLNAVIVAVSWAQVEPEEGRFDFAMVDSVIKTGAGEPDEGDLYLVCELEEWDVELCAVLGEEGLCAVSAD